MFVHQDTVKEIFMNNKTKAIIAVIIVAVIVLGVLFVNTTSEVNQMFQKIGAFVVAALVIIAALAIIFLILKGKQAAARREIQKAAKKAAETAGDTAEKTEE